MKRKIICAFVATSMAFSTFVSPVSTYSVGAVRAFAAEEGGGVILDSGIMKVRIAEDFPRVIDYTLGDKVFYGQPNAIDTIEVNGFNYINPNNNVPDRENAVWSKPKSIKVSNITIKNDSESATYTIPVVDGNIDSTVTVKIVVADNTLSYDITDITNRGSEKIHSIKIPNLSIISVRNSQESANFVGSVMSTHVDVEQKGDRFVAVDSSFKAPDTGYTENKYMYGIVSNSELSASVWSNSDTGGFNRISTTSYKVGDTDAFGVASSEWVYQDADLQVSEKDGNQPRPSLKVVITDDKNNDGMVNWNDGAIAYRDIMAEVKGSEQVPDQVAQRIAMNFGSMAPNPFLKTLDNVKRVYLATDGLGQKVLLKGYQSEGHDSAHPDYDDIGRRIGGVEDMKTLLDEGQKYGAVFGIHINAVETYPEADAFEDELLTGTLNWNWIDASFQIDTKYDWATGKRLNRLRALKELGLNLNFIYTDAWGNGGNGGNNWSGRRHAEEIKSVGYNVSTEWANKMEDDSLWSHWATDLNYGGYDLKGINSEVARFIHNHQKDVWMAQHPSYAGVPLNPLLGGYQLEGFEGWQGNTNFEKYLKVLYNIDVPTKFLQHFLVDYWENDEYGREKEIRLISAETKEDGTPLHNVIVKRAGKPGASGLDASRVIELDGVSILEDNYSVSSVSSAGAYLKKDGYEEDVKYLIPWTWENIKGNEDNKNDSEPKLYHWNLKGGSSTWTLPNEFQGAIKVYKLTDTGRVEADNIVTSNAGGQITLNAEASTPYIIVKADSSRTPLTITYGEKMHIVDPGFTSHNLNAWAVSGNAEIDTDNYYNPMIKFTQDGDAISQPITDLEVGKQYTALVYVENQSDTSNAIMEIQNGDETKSVYTEKSMHYNFVRADAHRAEEVWNGFGYVTQGSRMQTMQVTFVAKENTADLTLKHVLKEGKETDGLPSYFDDIRIVESKSDYYPEELQIDVEHPVFYQDFENVERGIYPFVPNVGQKLDDNRVHLSEKHAPYTQRGWNGGNHNFIPYMINDVIDGDWSLKTHAELERNSLLYNTIPQNFRFEPGITYDIEFQYECGSDGEYKFIYGSGEYDFNAQYATTWIKNTSSEKGPQIFKTSITGAEDGQTWFGILGQFNGTETMSKEEIASGKYDFIMDNLKITKTNKQAVDYIPDDLFKDAAEIVSITVTDADGNKLTDENSSIKNTYDKNTNTYWQTEQSLNYPVEIVIDLGKDQNINKFSYVPIINENTVKNGTIKNVDFSYCKDGEDKYTKVARNVSWEKDASVKSVNNISTGITARYLKLIVNDVYSEDNNKYISATEFIPYIMQAEPVVRVEVPGAIRVWDIWATNKDGEEVTDYPGEEIYKAIDGSTVENNQWHTSWNSDNNTTGYFPIDIFMDMDEVYELDKFEYVPRSTGYNGMIQKLQLSSSVDGDNWVDLGTHEFAVSPDNKTIEIPDGTKARYLKLTVIEAYGGFVSVREFIPYRFIFKGEKLDDAVKDAQKVINNDSSKVDDIINSIKDLSDAIVDYSKSERAN